MAIRTYRLDPAAFDVMMRRRWPLFLVFLLAPLVVIGFVMSRHPAPRSAADWFPIAFLAAAILVLVLSTLRRAAATARARWSAWSLAVSDNALRVVAPDQPQIEITRGEIDGVTLEAGKGLVLRGRKPLTIPEQVEDFADLEAHLRRTLDPCPAACSGPQPRRDRDRARHRHCLPGNLAISRLQPLKLATRRSLVGFRVEAE